VTSADSFPARILPATSAAPAIARRLVADFLSSYPSGFVDDALVLTSELVTNAVRHGQQDIELRIRVDNDTVRVEVSDASTELPRLVPAQVSSETGRGLLILAAIATAWGSKRRADGIGKTVWFELTGSVGHPAPPS